MARIEVRVDTSDLVAVARAVGEAAEAWPAEKRLAFYGEWSDLIEAPGAMTFGPGEREFGLVAEASAKMLDLLARYGVGAVPGFAS